MVKQFGERVGVGRACTAKDETVKHGRPPSKRVSCVNSTGRCWRPRVPEHSIRARSRGAATTAASRESCGERIAGVVRRLEVFEDVTAGLMSGTLLRERDADMQSAVNNASNDSDRSRSLVL